MHNDLEYCLQASCEASLHSSGGKSTITKCGEVYKCTTCNKVIDNPDYYIMARNDKFNKTIEELTDIVNTAKSILNNSDIILSKDDLKNVEDVAYSLEALMDSAKNMRKELENKEEAKNNER